MNDAYISAGFNIVRHSYHMQIELNEAPPAPVWPEGISLRPFVPDRDDEAVARVDREAFRDHWGFTERPLEADVEMLRHWMTTPTFDPALWLLAVDGDRIAGISLNAAEADEDPNMGWVGSLGVLREYRHKGLGDSVVASLVWRVLPAREAARGPGCRCTEPDGRAAPVRTVSACASRASTTRMRRNCAPAWS